MFTQRLTVVVVKARNLRPESDDNENRHEAASDVQNVFVKVKRVWNQLLFYVALIPLDAFFCGAFKDFSEGEDLIWLEENLFEGF